jgi:DNA-binding transcriptional LysR family regulator
MTDDTGINRMMQRFEELPESIRTPKNSVLTIAALVGLLENGKNLSILPALATPGYLNSSLIFRDIANPTLHREICLITVRKQHMRESTSAFYNFIQQERKEICGNFPNNTLVSCE